MGKLLINYNKLKYFTVVARYLNISRAAQELYLGQPALSTHIKELEEEIGTPLFVRTNRNLILTRAGEVLYEKTAAFFDGEEELLEAVRNAAIVDSPALKIGLVRTNEIHSILDNIHEFSNVYPNININISRYSIHELKNALENGEVDCAFQLFWSQNNFPSGQEFEIHQLQTGYFLIAMSKYHPLANRTSLSWPELKDCAFGIPNRFNEPDTYKTFMQSSRKAGFKINIFKEYPYLEVLLTAVDLGEVITMLSSLSSFEGYNNICCIPLENMDPIRLCLIRKKKNLNVAADMFINFMCNRKEEGLPSALSASDEK